METNGITARSTAGPPAWPARRFAGVALALGITAIHVGGTLGASHRQPERDSFDLLGYGLLVVAPLALLGRRRFPTVTLLVVFAATLGYWLTDYPRGPVFFPLVVALFTAILHGRRVVAWSTLAAGYVSFLWLPDAVGVEEAPSTGAIVALAAWLLLLGTVAEVARVRREGKLEAARMREEEARRRKSEERLRIARELHDVLGHHISLINVQAGVALHLIEERPEQARPALTAIKDASKEALSELRSVLAILRQVDEDAPRAPAPGLSRLGDLVSRAGSAGLTVRTEVEGDSRPLPLGVDLAVYRIVQEALTNVTRHAGPATAVVHVSYGDHDVTVQIDDDGKGAAMRTTRGGGSGIPGMRERAAALGGRLEAGPRPEGGFRVWARLPVDGAT